jgi:hypothetical protein
MTSTGLQHLLSQHASLAHWDEGAMVFHADVDEFLALMNPSAGNLADISLHGCLKGVTQGVMWPDETRASNCLSRSRELECFMKGALQTLSGLAPCAILV